MNITFRKLRIVLATVACCFVFMQSNAQLNTGDIAFTAFNMDGDDDFAIVALVDIPANTTIYFTDNEAQTGGGFNTGEGYLEWNSGASIVPAGTVITFTDTDSPGNANFGSSTGTLTDGSGTLNLAGGGDAIYAYLGTSETTPTTFLAGLANTTTSTSVGDYAANGLTAGQTMIIIPTSHDGGDYNGPRAGEANFADYLALIGNVANWTTNTTNGEALLPHNTTPFTILPAAPELNILDNSTPVACGATGTTILKADSVNINGETSSITVTIENTGTGDLDVSSLSIGGTHPTDFTIDGSNPSTPFTISATSSQNITITFDPSATGAREAVLLISSNDADEASCVVPLNGVGIVQELEVLDGASSIACGATGTTIFDAGVVNTILGSASTTITISNTGTDTLIIFGLVLGGTHMSDFTLDGSVPPTPFAVLPGTSQNVVVNFDPSADGARSATLTITSDDSDELSCMVPLNGIGFTPADLSVLATCNGISLPTEENMFHVQILNLNPGKTYQFDINNDGTPDVTGVTGVSLWTTAGQTGWPMAFSNGIGSDTIGVDTTNNGIINQTFIAHEILCTDIDGDNTVDNNTALCNTATVPEGEIIAQAAPYNGNNVYKYILTDANGIVFNPIVANYSGHFTGLLSGDYKVYAYNFVDTTDANLFCDSLIAGATDLDTVTSSLCVGVCGSAAYMVDCFICPDISLLTPSTTSLCFDDPMLDLTASIAMLHNSENGSTDFDVEFVYFTTQQLTAADVYNTPAGVLGTYDVTAGSITAASLTGATLPQTAGTYYIYARLLPAPVDLTCRPYAETMVSVADQIVFGAPFALQNPTCPGDANGAIDLTNSVTEGSNSPTAYNWTTIPTGAFGSGPFAFGPEGTYTVQVTFASGCTATNSYTLTDPDSLNITAVLTDPLCNNGTDGSIDITVTGGTAPYGPFDWNDGSFFTEDLTNISAGFYSVGVLDANGCNANASFTLNNPPAIVITATTLSANPCPGDSVASIDLTVSGGTEILDTISELIISEYGEGSSNNKWVEIFNGTGSPVDLSDYEIWRVSNGGTWPEATLSLSGTLNHNSSFLISNTGADTALTNNSNLTSGIISHSGDDAIGLAKLSVLIDAVGEDGPDPGTAWDVAGVTNGTKEHTLIRKSTILSPNTNWTMSAGTNTTDSEWIVLAQNNFSNAGSHTFTPSVSVPPYLYSWSNGASVEDINDLHDGIYTVTVTDGNGCTETASYDVTGIDSIPPTVICQDVTVYLGLTGSATVTTGDIDNGSFDDCPGALTFELEQTLFTCADLGQNQIKLTVTDSFANVDSCIATITVLDTITRSICTMVSQASSCGTNDGSATVLGNGVGPFTYMWDNGETTATAVALTAGAHTVIVTDNGIACSDTCEVTVTGPTLLAISCNVDANVTCNGNSDGAASVSVTGGIQPYIFSWTSGSVTGSATNLIEGTYTVSVTDQSGCTLTCSVTITEPTKLLATATWTDVSCNGAADGTATVVPSGGIPPYTYLWNDPLAQTSATATGLSGGNYIVTITDSNMCITTVGVPIFEPAPLANSPTVVQPLCNGDANGKITAIITGGTAPYIYTWSNGASTEINDNLMAGQYILTVTDSNNCVLVDTIVVDEPNLFDVSVTPETILCAGDSNANIVVNVIGGGTPPYAFLWNTSPAQTTASASNLSAGTYQLIITDDNGCDTVITAVVNENDPISVSPIIADVSCNGGNDGAIAILISGGAPAASGYNIIWSNGVTTQSNSGITAGRYTVTIGDSLGCEYVDSFVVAEPPALVLATSSDSVSCSGFSDGAAFVQVSGGTPPYAILWNDPLMQNTGSATNLVAGTYTVTVLDANNCTQSASVTVGEPSAVDGTSSVTNVSCNGGSDGSITVTPSGGTPGYTYMWSNGETTQTVSGLSAADYTVTITDANGCQKVLVITVSEPNELACTEVITDVLCHGESTGAILVTVSGGTPGYSYIWSNGDNGPLADSLSVGTYILTVTDANGCTKSSSYTLTQPDLLMTTTSQSNVSCKGGNDGTATVVVGGGVSPYSYSWSTSPVQTTNYVNGLSAGTYYVTITDANGCSIVDSVTLVQPSELLAFFLPTNPSCSGESDGSIDVLVGGGVGPYTYMWSNGASTEDVSGLAAGIHYVMIMDAHGCATMAIIYLTDLPPVQLTTAVMNVACNGNSSGMATAFATGGTGTYTYLWSDGQTNATASGLAVGGYTVTVSDGNSCTATSTVSISSSSALSCSIVQTDTIFCNGDQTAKLQANVIGGTAPYTYIWNSNPIQTTSSATGLGAGTYSVIVTDANGCTSSCSYEVIEPSLLSCTTTSTDAFCNADSSGSATVYTNGGTPNILPCHFVSFNLLTDGFPNETYWMVQDGSSLDTLIYNPLGTYTQGVNDSTVFSDSLCLTEGDTLIFTIFDDFNDGIFEPGGYWITIGGDTVASNFAFATFTASELVTIPIADTTNTYHYLWSNGDTTQTASNLTSGTYTVTVTDLYGCSTTCTVEIGESDPILTSISSSNSLCAGDSSGTASVTATGGTPGVFATLPGNQTSGSSLTGPSFSVLSGGALSGRPFDDGSCCDYNDPSTDILKFTVDVSGSYTINNDYLPSFAWDGYLLLYTDPLDWTQSPPITFVDGNDDCLFYNTSCITVNLNAGQNYYLVTTGFSDFDNGSWLTSFSGPGNAGLSLGDYAYQWSNGATTQTVGNLGAGTYYVTVTDGNGCTAIDSITIGGSTALQMDTITSTSVTCKGDADGTASIGNVSGGNTPYTVEWNTTPPQFTATALGLAPGIYSATVTDANGCTIIDSVEVTEPDEVLSLFLDGVQTVDCAGGSTGSATVLASGGTPPYSYLWSDGQVTGSATNLSAQIYVVTVTDENGCQDLISVPVASPFSLSVNVNKTDALCNSDSSGTASAVINGGTAPYSYIWLNALNDTLGTSSSVGSLYPGTYTIIVTDSSGCMAMNSFTIYQPSGLVQYTSVIDVTCNNGADGTATSIVFAGTPPYSYAWSNGQTTQTATNLTAGTYTVLITDGNGCVTVGDTAEIGQPVPILLNPNVTSLLCYGSDVGMIATQVTGGTPPYQYTWSTGESTPIISMLTAGVYTVTVSDLFGCTTDSVFTLVEADSISCTSVISMPSCNGGADGFITIDSTWGGTPSGSGPTGPINAIDTYCFSGQPFLSPGGISNVSTLSIPALPSGAIINSATLHLYGVNSINASWRSEFRVSLAGAYTLAPTQVDNNSSGGLISPDPSIPLVGFPATGGSIDLILSESFDDFGVDDATVDSACIIIDYTIPASGGGNSTAGYTYSWSNGQNGPTATGLTAGNWFVTITDSIGCSWTKCIKLPEPTALLCASSTIDISCFGEETGVVDLSVSGGTVFSTPPPVLVTAYSEDFETGAGGWASAGSANSWALGTPASGLIISAASGANAWITNLTGDYSVAEDSWVESPSIDLTPYISPVSVQFMINYETETSWDGAQLQSSIDGGTSWQQVGALNDPTNWYDDGSINGAGANWQTQEGWSGRFGSGSNGWVQASHDISGLTGASSVIFRVAFGSDFSGQDDGFAFDDFEVTAMQVGTATAPYTFAWSNGASTEDLNGVEAGTYTVTVTDGNGCTTICTATINQPDSISITASVNNASCALANGSLHAQGNGGAKPYTFLWSNGETTALINGLLSGNYTITITDLNGCTNSSVFVVDDTPVVLCSVSNFTEPTCNGYSDGTATATASGGTAPYSYSWNSNPVQLTQTANNLAAGVYIVTVTDSFGCTSTCSINLGQPDPITYSVQLGGNICSGTSTGSATVTVSGGTEPYIYVWSDGQSNSLATGLAAGNYYVTVTDVNGCSAIAPVSISTAQAISCNTYTVNSTCGMANGSAQVNVFGAVMPVTYLWSDGQDSSVAINLMAGNYTVTVTDANGCSTECYATVNTQGTLISYAIGLDVSCNGGNDGSASVLFVSGGTAPYSYQWSTGSTDSQILGLSVGTYVYTVTDSSGCVTIDSVEIVEPSVVGVTASGSNVSCYGYNDGSAAAVASGGSAPYLYTWSNGQGLSAINNLIAGTYTVTVSDANGCTSTDQITVLDGDSISCTFNIVDPALCEEPTGEVEIFPSGGTAPYTFVWATNPVQTTSTASNLPGGSVFVTITDANGCSKVECIKVPVQNGPQYSVVNSVFANGTNISCNGATDGFINVIIVSGGPVTYSWSNGATTSSISSLSAGTYTVMIAAGPCEISHTVTLVEPNALITSASGVDLNCAGVNSGLAMVNATGGTSPYSYSWNTIPPKFTPVITGLSAATYDVLVTDANGCTATNQVIISQPASVFSATENVTHISCNGLTDGMIDVTALGGQAPYLYNWMDGSTMEDRTGLSSGVYKLTISDNAGCAVIVCAAIAEPSLLLVGINSVGVSTPGGNDGSATAIATGGTWPYTYNWSNGTSTQSNSGLMSGFYIVTITDANGCTATESVEVLEPSSAFTSSGLSPEGFITKAIVYPNPNTGLFKLEIESTMNKEVYVDLFDISGRQLASDKLQLQDGVSSKEYNLQYAEKGIYFIRIYSDAKFEEVLRIILQ